MEDSASPRKILRYSPNDLFHLRASLPRVICSIPRINKHPDIVNIFRLPHEALRNPETFCCLTNVLPRISKKPIIPTSQRRQQGNSTEDSEMSAVSHNQQVQWGFRRRNGSGRSSQPYSAPIGIAAQQSENFRRFYRAVVSPTHVRVTAGGRIVPNTRSIAQLPFEWDGDKYRSAAADTHHEDANDTQAVNQPLTSGTSSRMHFIHNGFLSPFPSGSGLPGQNLTPYNLHQGLQGLPVQEQSFAGTHVSLNGELESRNAVSPLLPSAQFEQNKPLVVQGQMIYPLPHNFQPPTGSSPVQLSMLSDGTLVRSPIMPTPGMLTPHMAATGMHRPLLLPPGTQFMMPHPPMHHQLGYPLPQHMSSPFMSITALTRNQLHELRVLLRTIEDQLANNRHQIDVAAMATQQTIVQSQIAVMEEMLRHQMEAEAMHSPDPNAAVSGKDAGSFGATTPSFASTGPTDGSSVGQTKFEHFGHSYREPHQTTQQYHGLGLSEVVQMPATSDQSADRVASQSASRLSATAAMAPPFQPRSFGLPSSLPASAFVGEAVQERPAHKRSPAQAPALYNSASRSHGSDLSIGPQAIPYLVGTLPAGLKPSEASPTDLTYSRPLTEKEIQARRQYWGKQPRQSGLPKFDGKDFYPPSPVKSVKSYPHLITQIDPVPIEGLLPDFSNLFTEPGAPSSTLTPAQLAAKYPHLFAFTPKGETHTSSPTAHGPEQAPVAAGSNFVLETDYSNLFLEPGAPGYKTPETSQVGPCFSNTYAKHNENSPEKGLSKQETPNIKTSPLVAHSPPRKSTRVPIAESGVVLGMSSSDVSGGVTTATAQGHLPNYRGTAAASLSPAMLNVSAFDRDHRVNSSKIPSPSIANGSMASLKTAKQLSENRPLSRAIPIIRPPSAGLDAESYMRHLHTKDIPRTGPVMGSEW